MLWGLGLIKTNTSSFNPHPCKENDTLDRVNILQAIAFNLPSRTESNANIASHTSPRKLSIHTLARRVTKNS